MKRLKERADECDWSDEDGILCLVPDPFKPNKMKYFLNDHGVIDYNIIKEHDVSCIDSKARAAEDTRMLYKYKCIMNFLLLEGKAKLNIHDKRYIIGSPKIK